MFRKKKKTLSSDKDIRKSNTAIDLVPIIHDYTSDYIAGKDKYFNKFLSNTKPDDFSKNAMNKILSREKDVYMTLLALDLINAKNTAEKILLLQESEVNMILGEMEEEELLQRYITDMIEKGIRDA